MISSATIKATAIVLSAFVLANVDCTRHRHFPSSDQDVGAMMNLANYATNPAMMQYQQTPYVYAGRHAFPMYAPHYAIFPDYGGWYDAPSDFGDASAETNSRRSRTKSSDRVDDEKERLSFRNVVTAFVRNLGLAFTSDDNSH